MSNAARLVADIGGTNARFGWAQGGRVDHVQTLPVAQHASLAAAARAYLSTLQAQLGAPALPTEAVLAVATAITGDAVRLTNSPWSFSQAQLGQALGLPRLRVLNDFEALALSLPHLRADQCRPLAGPGQLPDADAVRAVIGPGTGLGVGAVVRTATGWQALPGEGGHATLAAGDDFEARLIDRVRAQHGHVSAERLLSGLGLPTLYAAVAAELGLPAREGAVAADIVRDGLSKADAAADRTLDVFCSLLGNFAGSVALILGARGGLYIGGGIVPRLGERVDASPFHQRFLAKGRFRGYLESLPVVLITDTLAALTGAAAAEA